MKQEKLYSLIPIDEFKALMGVDDRDDKLCRFCLVISTHTIEQYCHRRLLQKKHFEHIEYYGDLLLPLNEYPVSKVLAVYLMNKEKGKGKNEEEGFSSFFNSSLFSFNLLEPEFFGVVPDCGADYDLPFSLSLSPALKQYRNIVAVKAVYFAGYTAGKVPGDLAAACLELAVWNFNRYKGRKIGVSGNVGKEGGHLETAMPENVKALLEPYRRKLI